MIGYIISAVVSYFLGNISTSYIITKKFMGVDIRTKGSGNAGSTNVVRTLGKKAGVATFFGDFFKGAIAVIIAEFISKYLGTDKHIAGYLAVVFVVLGHNWPIVLGFRGGKGVATSLGSMIMMNPILALSCFAIFIVIVLVTKYVSLGSVIGIAFSILFMVLCKENYGLFSAVFLTASVIFTHRKNIVRLVHGEENKVGKKKNSRC